MALVHQIIDFVDDLDRAILKQASEQMPARLQSAQILTVEERERLPDARFALVMWTKEAQSLKKFPVTDAANTWLSCRYFEKTSEQLPFVAQKIAASNLHRACRTHGIEPSPTVEKMASPDITHNRYDEIKSRKEDAAAARTVKQASPTVQKPDSEHMYALGERYGMPNPEYTKKAAAYFADHFREFSDAEDRATFAGHVLARAQELGVQLEKRAEAALSRYAGGEYGDSVETQLRLRRELCGHKPEIVQAIDKLASHKATTEPQVFANVLFQLDKKAGLTRYYDGFLSDAYRATFDHYREKTASGYRWSDDQTGLSIDEAGLEKAANDKHGRIAQYFGSTLADSLKKHAVSIFESLPQDAKNTIVKIAKGAI